VTHSCTQWLRGINRRCVSECDLKPQVCRHRICYRHLVSEQVPTLDLVNIEDVRLIGRAPHDMVRFVGAPYPTRASRIRLALPSGR